MRRIRHFARIFVVVSMLWAGLAVGDEREASAPWTKTCRSYQKGPQFVKDAEKFCLRQHDQRACRSHAQVYFDRCRYGGNFEKMSARARARMLLVIALSSFRPVRHLDL
jgi:hypothetical protein